MKRLILILSLSTPTLSNELITIKGINLDTSRQEVEKIIKAKKFKRCKYYSDLIVCTTKDHDEYFEVHFRKIEYSLGHIEKSKQTNSIKSVFFACSLLKTCGKAARLKNHLADKYGVNKFGDEASDYKQSPTKYGEYVSMGYDGSIYINAYPSDSTYGGNPPEYSFDTEEVKELKKVVAEEIEAYVAEPMDLD